MPMREISPRPLSAGAPPPPPSAAARCSGSGGCRSRPSIKRSGISFFQRCANFLAKTFSFGAQRLVAHRIQDVLFLHVVLLHQHQQGLGDAGIALAVMVLAGCSELRQQSAHLLVLITPVSYTHL